MVTKDSKNMNYHVKSAKAKNKAIWIALAGIAIVLSVILLAIFLPGRIKETKEGIVFSKFGVLSKEKWIKTGEKTYYFDQKGHALIGLHEIENEFYFFDQDGNMYKGWLEQDGNKYYFQEDGKQVRGAVALEDGNYYFSKEDGALQTGAVTEDDQLIAYADEDGKLVTGVYDVEGKTYCFNEKGLLQTGWVTLDGKKSYCLEDFTAAKGKQNIEGQNYYFDDQAQLQIGWCENANGEKYYAAEDGSLVTGRQTIEDKDYFFTEDGVLKTGWINVNNDERYYAAEDGSILTGEQTIFNASYTFDENGKLVSQNAGERKMVALTFDDGPSVNTDRILDTLQAYNCRATFFVVGSRVASYPSQLKREHDLGCEIGSHTFNHKYLTRLSPEEMQSEIDQTNAAVAQVIGQNTTCIRPPGGFYNDDVLQRANAAFILWSVDTMDWKTRDPAQIIPIATSNIQDGDIILMHDLYSTTADSVEQIVPALLSQGFEIVTISELLDAHGGMFNGKVYFSTNKVK